MAGKKLQRARPELAAAFKDKNNRPKMFCEFFKNQENIDACHVLHIRRQINARKSKNSFRPKTFQELVEMCKGDEERAMLMKNDAVKHNRARRDRYQPKNENMVQYWVIVDEVVQFTNEYREMTDLAGKLGLSQEDLDALTGDGGTFASVGGPDGAVGFDAEAMAVEAGAAPSNAGTAETKAAARVAAQAKAAAKAAEKVAKAAAQAKEQGLSEADAGREADARQLVKKLAAAVYDTQKLMTELHMVEGTIELQGKLKNSAEGLNKEPAVGRA